MSFATIIRDAVFPGRCIGCGKIGLWLCPLCQNRLKPNLPECYFCRRLSPHYKTHKTCFSNKLSPISKLIVLWQYDEIISKLMSTYKYSNAYSISSLLRCLIKTRSQTLADILSTQLIIPMPLHNQRLKDRGFSPVEIIGQAIKTNHCPNARISTQIVLRNTNNPHQAFIKKELRSSAVKGIFSITRNAQLMQEMSRVNEILLIDDVITTGATINSLAKTLHCAFPWVKLNAVCLFRGKPKYTDICYNRSIESPKNAPKKV